MKKIYLDSEFGEIILTKHARSRRIRIVIKNRCIHVTLPVNGSYQQGISFFLEKKAWVRNALTKQQPQTQKNDVFQLQTLTFKTLGIPEKRNSIAFQRNRDMLYIRYPEQYENSNPQLQQLIKDKLIDILYKEAQLYLPTRLCNLALEHHFHYTDITIRKSKTRWGSCSSKKSINLSCYLMLLPLPLVDYVLLHELCHTKEMNHGHAFWKLLESVYPNAKEKQQEIRRYAASF